VSYIYIYIFVIHTQQDATHRNKKNHIPLYLDATGVAFKDKLFLGAPSSVNHETHQTPQLVSCSTDTSLSDSVLPSS
jgi:hypothetical protein